VHSQRRFDAARHGLYASVMLVRINGQPRDIDEGSDIHSLLSAAKLTPDKVAVELNRRLIRAEKYDTRLKEGDEIEIVTFVGGGA
jgi:thiamine biosynthesis protein ThiS